MFSINDFVSEIDKRDGLSRTNRFMVEFGEKNSPSLRLLCESTSLPGKQIMTNEYSSVKKAEKIPYNYLVDDVTFVFHLTNDYYVKKYFDEWTYKIISKNFRCSYHDEFTKEVRVWQMDTKDEKVYGMKLMGAFPITMNSVELSNATDNSTQKLTVTLTYEDYEPLEIVRGELAINTRNNEINTNDSIVDLGLPTDLLPPNLINSVTGGFA